MVSVGGEGGVGEKDQQANADLWTALELERRAGDEVSMVSGGLRGSEHGGGVVPVGFGRGEAVEERR